MIKKIIPKSEFTRNVITLVTGTAIAQAIPIAISPILTRLYSPEDFGVFALYLSITSVVSVIATGRYEFAITLPVDERDALTLFWLSCLLTFFTTSLFFIIIIANDIAEMLGNNAIRPWLYFMPLTVFLSGIYQSFNYLANRKRIYSEISYGRVIQSGTTGTTNLTLGFFHSNGPGGLILGNILGVFMSVLYFSVRHYKTLEYERNSFSKMKNLALRYKSFPKYDVPASFFNVFSNQSVYVFFNMFFDAVFSGYYFLTQKIFGLPINIIASSVQDVFKMEVVSIYNQGQSTRPIFLNTLKKLLLISIIPSIIIYFFAIDIFIFAFGNDWAIAGEYVKIMTPVFLLRFISFPLSYMIYVVEKQSYNTIMQILLLFGIVVAFFCCRHYTAKLAVQAISIVYSVFYFSYLLLAFKFTEYRKFKSEQ